MIAGHLDEIGFVVSYIDKNGYIRFAQRVVATFQVRCCRSASKFSEKQEMIVIEGAPAMLQEVEDRGKRRN